MFDPFKDFATAGYLRNVNKDKDPSVVKRMEHNIFRANIDDALNNLAAEEYLTYQIFLDTHRILFQDYYPWAGKDRTITLPNKSAVKGEVEFSFPFECRRAVDAGLHLGQNIDKMKKNPGEVMGLFAYGHPFLDGNGRTMLLIHMELCYRAGFSIAWEKTNKADYLTALTSEINEPGIGKLDQYLNHFKLPQLHRGKWGAGVLNIKGLDSVDDGNQIEGDTSDPLIMAKHRKYEDSRGYSYQSLMAEVGCNVCNCITCVCAPPKRTSSLKPR